jgi:hypothetical protein
MSATDTAILTAWSDLVAEAGRKVVYRDRAGEVAMVAVRGRSDHVITVQGSAVTTVRTVDWILEAQSLAAIAPGHEPQSLATITLPVDGGVQTYEVVSPGAKLPCFRYLDADERLVRIHSKLRSREPDA